MEPDINQQAIGKVMGDLALENADLRITVTALRMEIEKLKQEQKQTDEQGKE